MVHEMLPVTDVVARRVDREPFERVSLAVHYLRKVFPSAVVDMAVGGMTVRQIQKTMGGVKLSVVEKEIDDFCKRLILLRKNDVETIWLTLQ